MDGTQREKAIKEQRTNEAMKKRLLGPTGKLGSILKAFGTSIIRQSSGLYDSTYMEDPYDNYYDVEYSPTLSGQQGPISHRYELGMMDDFQAYEEGLTFDGLSRGMHIDITYWYSENRLTVTHRGFMVFNEIAGDLDCYVPNEAWESQVDKLFETAKGRLKVLKEEQDLANLVQAGKNKASFIENLRRRWGI